MDVAGWQLLLRSSPYLLSEALETTLTSAHDPLSTGNEIISLTTPRSPPLHSAPPPSPLHSAPPPPPLLPYTPLPSLPTKKLYHDSLYITAHVAVSLQIVKLTAT